MLIERSMGRANQVMDRNVKAWLSNHKSVSLPQIHKPYQNISEMKEHPLDRPKRAKLTIMMDQSRPGIQNSVLHVDFATVRRLYNCPFIDQDKVQTGTQFIENKKKEAKDIIINQIKRLYEEHQVEAIISDPNTTSRGREPLIEKLKSLKIMEYLSHQQLEEILTDTPFTKEELTQEI